MKKINVALRGAGGLLGHRLFREIVHTQDDMVVGSVILGTDEESYRRFENTRLALPIDEETKIFVDATRNHLKELQAAWGAKWELEPLDKALGVLKKADAIIDAAIINGSDKLNDFYSHYSRKKPIIHQSGTYPKHHPVAPPFEVSAEQLDSGDKNFRQGDCLVSGIAPIVFSVKEHVFDGKEFNTGDPNYAEYAPDLSILTGAGNPGGLVSKRPNYYKWDYRIE